MYIVVWYRRLLIFVLVVFLLQFFYHINTTSRFRGSLDIKINGFYENVNGLTSNPNVQTKEPSNNNTKTTITVANNDKVYAKIDIHRNNNKHPISQHSPTLGTKKIENIQKEKIPKSFNSRLTFDDPRTYVGAVVEGWPPWRDRDVSQYMNEPFTSIPVKHKLVNKTLIVIVPSTPSDIDDRSSCRRTWGRHANNQTSVLFLLGREKNLNKGINAKISREKEFYGDIIYVDNLIEHYDNLTLKTLYAIKFFLQADLFQPKPPKYMMKIDDDSFVNLPLLYKELTENEEYSNVKSLVMGRCWCHQPRRVGVYFGNFSHLSKKHKQKIYKSRTSNNGKFVNKWIVPRYMYNGFKYPNYLSGSGYVLSRQSADCIFERAKNVPYFHLEDIFITGFAREACHIQPRHHPGFSLTDRGSFDIKKDVFLYFTQEGYMDKVKTKFSNRISKYKPYSWKDS